MAKIENGRMFTPLGEGGSGRQASATEKNGILEGLM